MNIPKSCNNPNCQKCKQTNFPMDDPNQQYPIYNARMPYKNINHRYECLPNKCTNLQNNLPCNHFRKMPCEHHNIKNPPISNDCSFCPQSGRVSSTDMVGILPNQPDISFTSDDCLSNQCNNECEFYPPDSEPDMPCNSMNCSSDIPYPVNCSQNLENRPNNNHFQNLDNRPHKNHFHNHHVNKNIPINSSKINDTYLLNFLLGKYKLDKQKLIISIQKSLENDFKFRVITGFYNDNENIIDKPVREQFKLFKQWNKGGIYLSKEEFEDYYEKNIKCLL